MAIVPIGMNDPVLRPSHESVFVDAEAIRQFLFRQHASISKPIVAMAR